MGGIGSGGHGAVGRKPKDDRTAFVHGKDGAKARTKPGAPLKPVGMPAGMSEEQKAVWSELAPHAMAARTLTAGTCAAFRDLCEAIVLKRRLFAAIEANGLTYLKVTIDGAGQEHTEQKANPLLSQHRGTMQRVEAGFVRFRLAPVGKEIAADEAPEDPFAEYDGETAH